MMQGAYKEWKLLIEEIGGMQREDRTSYIVRKMQEDRKFKTYQVGLEKENCILRNNVKELQQQLQAAYIRIGNLNKTKQLELDL